MGYIEEEQEEGGVCAAQYWCVRQDATGVFSSDVYILTSIGLPACVALLLSSSPAMILTACSERRPPSARQKKTTQMCRLASFPATRYCRQSVAGYNLREGRVCDGHHDGLFL